MTDMRVRILKNWDYPDLLAQTPGRSGIWDGIRFFEGDGDADYVVVLNQPSVPVEIDAARDRVWAIIQEPPTPFHRHLHVGQRAFGRIYTPDPALAVRDARYRPSQPALAWHVGLSFDELAAMHQLPPKSKDVSWITSSLAFLPGHKVRLRFLEQVRQAGIVDLFGRGLNPIPRKWEALAPYRYSIVFENHIGPYYWSEKLADCFLAGAMPIYVGCTNLEEFFPAESFVRIDPRTADPRAAIRRIMDGDVAERNRDALLEARRRVLYELQLFPFVAREIAACTQHSSERERLRIGVRRIRNPLVYGLAVWHWKIRPLVRAGIDGILR